MLLIQNVLTNTGTINIDSWPKLSIEVSPDNLNVIPVFRVFLDCSVDSLDVMIRIPRVVKVHAHQHDTLMIHNNRCCHGPFTEPQMRCSREGSIIDHIRMPLPLC